MEALSPHLLAHLRRVLFAALICSSPGVAVAQSGPSQRYEAESATLTGVAVFSGRGASGGAYADFQSANGDAIEWTVVAGQSGTHELSIAYALGASAPRPVRVTVNGAEMPLAFP
ncbi:MAG: hypothetical protein AAFZ18_11655, partial [Myxococcota bacterium]